MATEANRSSRMFEPASGAMFSDSANENPSASNANGNAADSQSMQQSTTAENLPAGPIGPNERQPGGFGSAPVSTAVARSRRRRDDGNGSGNDGGAQAGADDNSGVATPEPARAMTPAVVAAPGPAMVAEQATVAGPAMAMVAAATAPISSTP